MYVLVGGIQGDYISLCKTSWSIVYSCVNWQWAVVYPCMRRPGRLYSIMITLIARWCASPQPITTTTTYHPLVAFSPRTTLSLEISSNSKMSQPSLPPTLQEYKDKTGCSLVVDHPFAKQFQKSDSVKSNTTILEEQPRVFRKFRDHEKLVNSFKRLVNVFCLPLSSPPFLTRSSS